jgi:parallel beta-helix repeat protein
MQMISQASYLSVASLAMALLLVCGPHHHARAADRYVSGDADTDMPDRYRTISDAMIALQPGDHLIIAAGRYREGIRFAKRDWSGATPTIIEGRGHVVIDAADVVTDWVAQGDGIFYHDWPHESAQVLIDGVPLSQVGGSVFGGYPSDAANPLAGVLASHGGIWPGRRPGDQTTLNEGDFFYDGANQRLYLRTSITGLDRHVVEVATRTFGLLAQDVDSVQVSNLIFRHGNTSPTGRNGVVTLIGRHLVLRHVSVDQADAVGMLVEGDDNLIADSSANRCGQLGMLARGARLRIERSETDGNNTRGFNKSWEAGGAKFVGKGGLRDSVIFAHTALGNHGDGIWFDWGNRNNRIENSRVEYNSGFGIQYEASSGAQIVGNQVIGNGQRGIYLPQSSDSVVRDNLVAANGMEGIAIVDEGRRDPAGKLDLQPRANAILDNVIAWNGSAITVPDMNPDVAVNDNVFIGQAGQLRESVGWSRPFDSFADWQKQMSLDKQSVRIERPIDATFARSVQARERDPDLDWLSPLREDGRLPTLPAATSRMISTRRISSAVSPASADGHSPNYKREQPLSLPPGTEQKY